MSVGVSITIGIKFLISVLHRTITKNCTMSLADAAPIQSVTRHRNEGNLQKYAEQSRKAERFNDVYIKVGNTSFPTHRLVLACYSQFFERLFQTPMKEQYEGTVNLNELDGEAVRLLIEYMYVGSITINQDNVFNLLATANFLQMDEACQFCFDFLEVIISIENWSTILSTLGLYENDSVLKQLYQFIWANFDNITKCEHFKALTIQELTRIVQNLDRNVLKETSIYDALIGWIRHDESKRKNATRELLLLVDLHKLPCNFLEDVVATDPVVNDNNDCLKTVMSAITKQFKEMRLREQKSKLISVGGVDNPCKVVEIFSLFSSAKSVYPDLPSPAYHSKSLELNGYIYSIGGSSNFEIKEDTEYTNKVYRISINNSETKWEEVCPMNEEKYMMGAAVFKDRLVVAGGEKDETNASQKEEIYNPVLNKWQQISKLNQERMFNELVSCDGCLFSLGGNDDNQYFSSMEKLSDLDGEWQVVEAMNEPRTCFAAVNCEGEIYAIGGCKEYRDGKVIALKSVEKYNPVERQWSFVADMKTERIAHAACVLRCKIFVVGGADANNDPIKTIECYDPKDNKWTLVGETEDEFCSHSLIAI